MNISKLKLKEQNVEEQHFTQKCHHTRTGSILTSVLNEELWEHSLGCLLPPSELTWAGLSERQLLQHHSYIQCAVWITIKKSCNKFLINSSYFSELDNLFKCHLCLLVLFATYISQKIWVVLNSGNSQINLELETLAIKELK